MFDRVLIANRGEIAVRIMKTCRRLGISPVIVTSEADQGSLAVAMADEAVLVGPAPAAQSYLVIERILEAVQATGAQAVHPGFGFLSENAAFAEALAAAGVTFIGPNPRAIAAMGDKIASKKLAKDAGVSTIPGWEGAVPDAKTARKAAEAIGFPVMIKASAGGGGKGMRVAHALEEVEAGFESARNEARASFGDDRILMERFVERPRHIEIQVLGDTHGQVLHLGERECSIQRRNQKVLEEAPSPFLDPQTRAAMGAQAVALAQAVDYDSAGTVEFIVDPKREFFFLEMNTRLQVEHPVTEMVAGLDLVERMIRSAAGERLDLSQEDVDQRFASGGWAVEARLYAEDPRRGFLPSIGRLRRFRPPAEGPVGPATFRMDSGVREGDEISIYYDPMIAKMIAHGPDRAAAIDGLAHALDQLVVEGVRANGDFLAAVVSQDAFRAGALHTGYLGEHFPDGFQGVVPHGADLALLAAAGVYAHTLEVGRAGTAAYPAPDAPRDWRVDVGGALVDVCVSHTEGRGLAIAVGADAPAAFETAWLPGDRVMAGRFGATDFALTLKPTLIGYELARRGARVAVTPATPAAAALRAKLPVRAATAGDARVLSPMPGLVSAVKVDAGQDVKAGEPLVIVEAMKMENVIHAERDGAIKAVRVAAGDSVAADDVLVEFA